MPADEVPAATAPPQDTDMTETTTETTAEDAPVEDTTGPKAGPAGGGAPAAEDDDIDTIDDLEFLIDDIEDQIAPLGL